MPLLVPAPTVNVAPLPLTAMLPVLLMPLPAFRLPPLKAMVPELAKAGEPLLSVLAVAVTLPALVSPLRFSVTWLRLIVPPSLLVGTATLDVPGPLKLMTPSLSSMLPAWAKNEPMLAPTAKLRVPPAWLPNTGVPLKTKLLPAAIVAVPVLSTIRLPVIEPNVLPVSDEVPSRAVVPVPSMTPFASQVVSPVTVSTPLPVTVPFKVSVPTVSGALSVRVPPSRSRLWATAADPIVTDALLIVT